MAVFIAFFLLLMFLYGVVIERYRKGWNRIPVIDYTLHEPHTFVSVIIAARNEAGNISRLMLSLQKQEYPTELFEIIIAEDDSEDETYSLLQSYSAISNLKVISLLQNELKTGHKKHAIETAIKAAKGTLIITTDADCTFPARWLSTMVAAYENSGAKMIAAPVKFEGTHSFLFLFQVLDFFSLQGITGAAVYNQYHILCNGANLAYEKKIFEEVKGFEGVNDIASGDDMLLMEKIWTKYPGKVSYLKSNDAIVSTIPPQTWKGFMNQRIRWAGKTAHYENKRILRIMLLVYALNISFLVLLIMSFWMNLGLFFLLLFLLAKIVIEFPFIQSVASFFNQSYTLKYFPLLQPIHILYTILTGFLARFSGFEWKGRVLKK